MLGAFFALMSAATFGFNAASARKGMITGTAFQAMAVTVPMGVPLFLVVAVMFGQTGAIFGFSPLAYFYLCLAGVLHFTWGRWCNYRATKAMGANLTGPVQQFNMVVALVVAMIVLGETLTPIRIFGLVLVLVGPAIMISGRGKKKGKTKTVAETAPQTAGADAPTPAPDAKAKGPVFEPNYVEGYTFALASAAGQGVSPVLIRLSLEGTEGTSMAAGFISYLAATVLFAFFLLPRGRMDELRTMDRRVLPWFLNSGFFAFLAQMFRYLALAIAPVTVVTPIQRTSVVFRTIFSTILSRDHEVLDARVITGIVISLVGAVALAASMEMVAEFIALPPAVMEWEWP